MSVDTTTIIAQLQSDLRAISPDLDVSKGPLYRLYISAHSTLVSRERDQIDRLIGLSTLQRLDNILDNEIDAQVSAFSGMGRFQGRKSHGFATFYTRTRPLGSITINIGDQVSDSTSTLIYRVTQQVIVTSDQLVQFYNPITQRFEILAPIEAMTIGADYDVPSGRIKRILSPIDFIDGVINTGDITNGYAIEDNDTLDGRFRKRLEGQSLGTKGGLISELVNIPGVNDIVLVSPADPDLFSRRTDQPALDIYVLGDIETTDIASFTVRSDKDFQLPPHLITSITSVTLDGESVLDYAFIRDSSVLAGSVQEVDTIELRNQPDVGSVVVVTFTFNSLLETVQDRASQNGDYAYFEVDLLTYAAIPAPLAVAYNFSFLSSFDKTTILSALQNETLSYLNPNAFMSTLQPESLIADLQKKIPSATSIVLKMFTTKLNSNSAIEIVQLQKNQYPILAQADLQINLIS